MTKYIAIIALVITIYPCSLLKSAQYNFGHLNYSQGLSNNRVLCFAEDDNGFMWFGTNSGLNKYDGYTITNYLNNPKDSLSLPNNMVQIITKDQLGRFWIKTADGFTVFDLNTEKFTTQKQFQIENNSFTLKDINLAICYGDSSMIFHTTNFGIVFHNIYSNKSNLLSFKSFNLETQLLNSISHITVNGNDLYIVEKDGLISIIDMLNMQTIQKIDLLKNTIDNNEESYRIFVDNSKGIWVYSNDKEYGVFNIQNDQIFQYNKLSNPSLNSNLVSAIIQDEKNNIWIGTDHGGINILDQQLNTISIVKHDDANRNSLKQNVITSLFKSSQGIVWIGTFKQGVNYYHKSLFRFNHYKHQANNSKSLIYNDVNCFAEDNKGNLYIGTNSNGLMYFNRSKNTFSKIPSNLNNKNGLKSDVIVSLCYDKNNMLWIGTYHGGLSVFDGKNFKTFLNDPKNPKTISDNRVWKIYEDTKGNLWIGLLGGGLDLYDRENNLFRHFSGANVNTINSKFVMDICEDSDNNLWFATDNGLYMLDYKQSIFKNFSQNENPNSISSNFATAIYSDSKNNIWVGTRNGLNMLSKKSNSFTRFTTENGLPNNSIKGVVESAEGNIWISTTQGLAEIIVEYNESEEYINHQTFTFNETDGLQAREFNEGSFFRTSENELIFGGPNGFNLFKTKKIHRNNTNIKTKITGLEIFGNEVDFRKYNEKHNSIEKSVLNKETLHLPFNENIFSLKFLSIDFITAKKINYRYKLEGFNDQWIYTTWKDRKATFTNLNPGKYRFIVQANNYATNWDNSESYLNIIIHPPWYRTWLAYALYFAFVFSLILFLRRMVILKERAKFKEEQIAKEAKRQQELNALKTRFFTNVSHEFRTPLSLIITPLEKLIKNATNNDDQKHLNLMQQNAKRLLNLVNQLLDFRKIEENKLKVNYIFGNVIGFMAYIIDSFSDYRESKNIELDFLPDENELFMQFDKDKLEKIIFNLLSNAFKFTPEKGYIRIFTEIVNTKEREHLKIVVKDSGIGINTEQQAKIFDRFYQSDLPDSYITKGSGIGLSLTKDFVKLLNGSITVKSEPNKGSKFIILLPINREIPKNITEELNWASEPKEKNNDTTISKNETAISNKTIMVVEDNTDFRYYLKDSLQREFNIIECENGRVALDHLKSKQPDLIVSDVMMPEMDGLALCNEIKTNATFSHIPVILLTAKSTQQDKLEGLKQGADEYISKPFSLDILKSRINYLLAQRQKFINHYQKSFQVESENNCITPIDEKLLKKANSLINENIGNSEYSVEKLSKDLGMSRVYLYKKLSSLTGKTPVELIRLIRIKKAAELLINSSLTVSEVAYEVGFTDPRYFSKQFKNEFDVLPSKFKENQG